MLLALAAAIGTLFEQISARYTSGIGLEKSDGCGRNPFSNSFRTSGDSLGGKHECWRKESARLRKKFSVLRVAEITVPGQSARDFSSDDS